MNRFFLLLTLCTLPAFAAANECVILLHGLARTSGSMDKMEGVLGTEGYRVVNQDYPSREHPVEVLAEQAIPAAIEGCGEAAQRIHFVTHSMGGILVRYWLANHELPRLGRVVMLSPPNQGSEVVDRLGHLGPFQWLNGPAGDQLGTGPESLPNRLGPVGYEVGVITGDRTINPILSTLIPGDDDGKVSIESAKIEGMRDFLVVPRSHPLIMDSGEVIAQTIRFLREGRFRRGE